MAKAESALPVAINDFYKTNGTRVVMVTSGPSMTRQEFAEECDINSLMRRYEGHNTGPGLLPNQEPPFYADFTQMPSDLMGYMEMMDNAERSFMTLNANVRKEFDNNALEFVAFASDPGNIDQMRAWGLAKPLVDPKAVTPVGGASAPAPIANPPVGASEPAGGSSTHGST